MTSRFLWFFMVCYGFYGFFTFCPSAPFHKYFLNFWAAHLRVASPFGHFGHPHLTLGALAGPPGIPHLTLGSGRPFLALPNRRTLRQKFPQQLPYSYPLQYSQKPPKFIASPTHLDRVTPHVGRVLGYLRNHRKFFTDSKKLPGFEGIRTR